jgi:hypothetical protein
VAHLKLDSGLPDFQKAVISFWFKVPSYSLKKALETKDTTAISDADEKYVWPLFNGVIPLITFGPYLIGNRLRQVPRFFNSYVWTIRNFDGSVCDYVVQDATTLQFDGDDYEVAATNVQEPCFIGVEAIADTVGVAEDGSDIIVYSGRLCMALQMGGPGTASRVWQTITGGKIDDRSTFGLQFGDVSKCPPDKKPYITQDPQGVEGYWMPWPPDNPYSPAKAKYTYDGGDVSSLLLGTAERFTFGGFSTSNPNGGAVGDITFDKIPGNRMPINVSADAWHHVLVSFDLNGDVHASGNTYQMKYGPESYPPDIIESRSLDSSCQMWIAFDDIDYGDGFTDADNPRAIVTDNAAATYNAQTNYDFFVNYPLSWQTIGNVPGSGYFYQVDVSGLSTDPPTFDYTADSISANAWPVCIPGDPDVADPNEPLVQVPPSQLPPPRSLTDVRYHVEMAELQIYTDVTVNTEKDTERRLFISADGTPVNPGAPDKQNTAMYLLRKRPEIMLRGSSAWKRGFNSGSLGVNAQGEVIPGGQFKASGTILNYKPSPKAGLEAPDNTIDAKADVDKQGRPL